MRAKPDTVLIVDAVHFGGYAGEARLLPTTAVDTTALSTHVGSLSMLREYLSERTGASIHLLAIQPVRIDASEGLSLPVEASVRELAVLLSALLD